MELKRVGVRGQNYIGMFSWCLRNMEPSKEMVMAFRKNTISTKRFTFNPYPFQGYFRWQLDYSSSQQTHEVYTTSPQRRCNVMTLHRRWGDVVQTSYARWVYSIPRNRRWYFMQHGISKRIFWEKLNKQKNKKKKNKKKTKKKTKKKNTISNYRFWKLYPSCYALKWT